MLNSVLVSSSEARKASGSKHLFSALGQLSFCSAESNKDSACHTEEL